jgi:preprotein translocase subunit YajC
MVKNELTPEESFSIIDKAISNIKTNYKESAQIFLLWGWILSLACFAQFIILTILKNKEAYNQIGLFSIGNWVVLILIGFIFQFFIIRKINKKKKVYSYLEEYLKSLWTVIVVSFLVAAIISIKLEIELLPVILLIAGIGTTTTGLLIRFKPLVIGGVTFFIFSIATTFVSNEYLNLIAGTAIICGHLIPGYLLKSAKEK